MELAKVAALTGSCFCNSWLACMTVDERFSSSKGGAEGTVGMGFNLSKSGAEGIGFTGLRFCNRSGAASEGKICSGLSDC